VATNGGRRHLAPASFLSALWILALVACGGGSGTTTSPSPNDPALKLQAAATTMRMVETFQFTAEVVSASQKTNISGEFAAPDALHETVKIATGTLEVIRIGTRTYRRDSPTAAWQLVPPSKATTPTDPRLAFTVLAKATDVHLQGSTYLFTLTTSAATSLVNGSSSVTGSAVLAGGRITDLTYKAAKPVVSVHLTYAGFNATPRVAAPPGM
jgi:hypothetical protein